jgi:hypothetical protein
MVPSHPLVLRTAGANARRALIYRRHQATRYTNFHDCNFRVDDYRTAREGGMAIGRRARQIQYYVLKN